MLPTTYRGNAIIDDERISGVLHLSSDSIRLTLDNNQEILRWPIGDLDVDATGKGTYELRHDHETFTFEPVVDDGLGEEISLRRRFFAPPTEYERPKSPGPPVDDPTPVSPPRALTTPTPPPSVTDRVPMAGRHSNGSSLFRGEGDRFRRYLLMGSLGLLLLIVIAIAVSVITSDRPTTGVAAEPVATTLPPPSTALTTTPGPASTAEPVPSTAPTVSTTPPTVASATVTTAPIGPAPAGSVFEITPGELAERWDTAVAPHSTALLSEQVGEDGNEFAFDAGPFVRLQGSTEAGTVSRIAFVGDPSGTVEDDREVLTALGMTLSLLEPELPPEGRRELLRALGLDVENPDLNGLDNTLAYRGNTYRLRWDTDLERLVLDVRPAAE